MRLNEQVSRLEAIMEGCDLASLNIRRMKNGRYKITPTLRTYEPAVQGAIDSIRESIRPHATKSWLPLVACQDKTTKAQNTRKAAESLTKQGIIEMQVAHGWQQYRRTQ